MKKTLLIAVTIFTILSTMLASSAAIAQGGNPNDVVSVKIQSSSITWTPTVGNVKGITLTIAGPDGFYSQEQYGSTATISSESFGDGAYVYEIILQPKDVQDTGNDQSLRGLNLQSADERKQSGTFTVAGGSFVTAAKEPNQNGPKKKPQGGVGAFDVVHADDLIVQGSGCFGFDCVNNESFGFDTIRLKENNLRIGFNDTSIGAFPSNDWTIVANDSASGGASFLGFEDVTGARFPFKVMAGAPTNSLFVSSNGDLGVRTSTPVLDFHASTSDTPGVRLEQTNAGGFTAQTWDMAGNEANFFIRDVTGGSLLSFRIRPGAPTSSIDIAADGDVGIGTASPIADLDIANAGAPAGVAVRRTDNGVTLTLGAGLSQGTIGTSNNFPLAFTVNSVQKMTLATDGSLTVLGPVTATAFNPSSDRNLKENFAAIDQKTVLQRLASLPISTWNFIENDNKTKHMGPMAQDFYAAFGLGADDKHISTVDADGVAFAAIQELNNRNQALSSENTALRSQVDNLAARVSALESGAAPSGQSSQTWMIILLVAMNMGLIIFLVWSMRRKSFSDVKLGNG